MTQTSNRFFDEMARLMNDAAGVAQGVRREFDTLFRSQAERILRDLDVVQREEFEAVKEMARLAREENEALKAGFLVPDFLPFASSAAITRPVRGPRHPWRLAAFTGGEKGRLFHWLRLRDSKWRPSRN
jgi:BMFP domain-containing protein YqiC